MRIAIDIRKITDFGIGPYIWNLIKNLSAIDTEHEFYLLGSPDHFVEIGPLAPNFEPVKMPKNISIWNFHLRTLFFIKHEHIDLLHVPHHEAPFFTPCPLVVTVHDCVHLLYPQDGSSRFANYRQYLYTKRIMNSANRVLTVSESTNNDLVNIFGIDPHKTSVIHNSLDERFTATPNQVEQKNVLEKFQIHEPFILYSGQIKPHKNIQRLIEAFAVLKSELNDNKEYQTLKLIIIGDPLSKHQNLRFTAVRSGVQDHVRFLGFIPYPALKVFYESAALFVSPSLHEGFSLSSLEAMASETPVVAANTSSMPEVLGDAARLVNPENVFDISRAMKQMLLDPILRKEAIEKGVVQVQKFSWRSSAEKVLDNYNRVIYRDVG